MVINYHAPVINQQAKMNIKSLVVIVLVCLVNLKGFQFSEIHFNNPDSLARDNFRLRPNLRDELSALRTKSRSYLEKKFWDAIESKDYESAERIKIKFQFNLDCSDQDTCDDISELLACDETPLTTLQFLYEEYPHVFQFFGYVDASEGPFYRASKRNINFLTINYPLDRIMMKNIREAMMLRE